MCKESTTLCQSKTVIYYFNKLQIRAVVGSRCITSPIMPMETLYHIYSSSYIIANLKSNCWRTLSTWNYGFNHMRIYLHFPVNIIYFYLLSNMYVKIVWISGLIFREVLLFNYLLLGNLCNGTRILTFPNCLFYKKNSKQLTKKPQTETIYIKLNKHFNCINNNYI